METLVDKAWELYRLTAHFPNETILQAAQWLEARHCKTPGGKLAVAIALHYILLARREDIAMEARRAEDYHARAARWYGRACASSAIAEAAKAGSN